MNPETTKLIDTLAEAMAGVSNHLKEENKLRQMLERAESYRIVYNKHVEYWPNGANFCGRCGNRIMTEINPPEMMLGDTKEEGWALSWKYCSCCGAKADWDIDYEKFGHKKSLELPEYDKDGGKTS